MTERILNNGGKKKMTLWNEFFPFFISCVIAAFSSVVMWQLILLVGRQV